MTVLLPSATRRSRFLFEWVAARCLEALDQSLDATTGQAATFARASSVPKYVLDANGRYYALPHSIPAFEWGTDPVSGLSVPRLRLDAQSTNLVVQSDVCTAATGWTISGTATAVASAVYAGRQFTLIGNATGGPVARQITFTGNGTKAFSFLIRQNASVSGTTVHFVYDATAGGGTVRGTVTCTISSAGVVTAVPSAGATVLAVLPSAEGGYRVYAQATGVIAANTNWIYASNNTGTAASFLISGVQVENGTVPSALIPTTTATVTAGVETLTFPFRYLPAASTWYVKFVEAGTILTGLSSGLLGIGASTNPALFFLNDSAGHYDFLHREATDVFSVMATSPTLGQGVELRGVLGATGTALLGQSINGGAESVATQSAALALPAAWFDTTLTFNDRAPGGSAPGFTAIEAVRIAAGVQTLAYMRAG